ncbi:YafY family protein [Clostridium tertium]|jgi:predicted DNA-binding transcriptional regulator YafY|uniref:helix-turn-helix transcriptional regulator n=1 Tax=Clostridium TaxID=1485 RepID=UPI001157C8F8|nr:MULTISPECIES: YafY family protein [Clostridium]MBS5305717.1 YafY family transcriptional regulator [Clostridium sp.]MDB1922892.1 YafY family protein [Clostridium tertium]MDB1927784.1 YafY family protein [Clostridium tertium]MDB1929133.1 YafY family protein [Clostridium tertium]MDB1932672.1 YafY family protein [Clostridium tertium]
MKGNRLFEIIYTLLDKKNVTAKELAEHFEVSQRTIYRDIEDLSQAGVPIYMTKGKGGGISLLSDFILNKAILSQKEKKEILAAMQGLNAVNKSEFNGVLSKLSSFLGGDNENWIEVDFSNWDKNNTLGEKFTTIKNSIINKNLISFEYFNSNGKLLERIVEPLKLVFKGQGWYLYAYCREREDNRFFKLTRMSNINIILENFNRTVPNKIFSEEDTGYYNELIHLKLRIDKKLAFRIYDEFHNYSLDDNGDFIVNLDFPSGDWLFGYLMSFGEYIEVLEPLNIRDEIKKKLMYALKKY